MLKRLWKWLFPARRSQQALAIGWVRYNPNAERLDDRSVRVLGLLIIDNPQ